MLSFGGLMSDGPDTQQNQTSRLLAMLTRIGGVNSTCVWQQ
jgi:hypothetical protein